MNILEAFGMILSACGLARNEMQIEASVFRCDGARTNIGLINADNLSIQIHIDRRIHIDRATPGGGTGIPGHVGSTERAIPRVETKRAATPDRAPDQPEPDAPRIVDRHLFDVRKTFVFDPAFVFDERRLTINTIPIHFVRTGGRIVCDLKIRNAMLYSEAFLARDGALCMAEGGFESCTPPPADAWDLESCDERLSSLLAGENGRFYGNGNGHLVCIFPTPSGAKLPLGTDDATFPGDRFGPVYLICFARRRRRSGARYRVHSHFYVATGDDGQPRGEMRR